MQFASVLVQVAKSLEKDGYAVEVVPGSERLSFPGHALGCDMSAIEGFGGENGAIVFIGAGEFHLRSARLCSQAPILAADPVSGSVEWYKTTVQDLVSKREELMRRARSASCHGILLSTKDGQCRFDEARRFAAAVEKKGLQAYIVIGDVFSPADVPRASAVARQYRDDLLGARKARGGVFRTVVPRRCWAGA